ncbi:MAG: aldehyde:ferredoxin oxidoreductase, partial [Deltaproteobacteria bacterium]|nr:aldehyde:ferredoxin oxidoreductase [Deltaproteobacteria bacterium]
MLKNRSQANILYIDLSKKDYYIKNRPELLDKYIGGTGIAAQLLLEECPEGCDPLSPESPIILAVGPLTPFFPLASKTVALFKSPLTGNLGESHCGGRSAISIASAQLTAIVIKGKSKKPVFLTIDNERVYFKDATTLWGMDSNFTTGRILRQHEKGSGIRTIMRIGKGGENKVLFSGVNVETFRHFGRLGLGAVFGSKHLKALVITGQSTLEVTDNKEYKKVYKEIYETATESKLMNKYHDLGTAGNVKGLSDLGGLPTRNLQSGSFEKADDISGESFAKEHLGRRLACSHCPVGCIHVATLREPDPNDPFFFKTSMIGYDYEPIFAAGSMLG